MGKIDLLDNYIKQLSEVNKLDNSQVESLIEDITRVVLSPDDLTALVLDYYWAEDADYSSDIRKLKSKLEYDKAILMDEQEKANKLEKVEREKRELEKLRLEVELSKSNVTINNTNHNEANATSTVSITIDQTIKAINEISPEVLSAYEKEELEEKLSAIEVAKTSGNKEKLAGKVGNVLKYIADKGIEVGIAALPYLGEIAKLIQNL